LLLSLINMSEDWKCPTLMKIFNTEKSDGKKTAQNLDTDGQI